MRGLASVCIAVAACLAGGAASAAGPDSKALGPYACLDDRMPAPPAQEIIAACTKALNSRPGALLRLNLLVRRAEGYDMAGDDAHAVADFTEANYDSHFFGFLGQRGSVLEGQRDHSRAIADLREATRLRPDYEIAWVNLAVAYLNAGDKVHAEATLTRATKLSDRDPVSHNALAYLYLSRGDKAQALAEFNAAIAAAARAGPDDSYNRSTGQAYAGRAALEIERGDLAAAVADLDADVRLNPKDAGSHNDACHWRIVANTDLKRAEAECDRAVELSKDKAEMLDTRAFLEAREGRWSDARTDADAALKAAPKLASSLYLRGLAEIHLGDRAGGEADIAAADGLNPNTRRQYESWGLKAP